MKSPQERKTAKRLTDRDRGEPNISMHATDDSLSLREIGESQSYPPTFRGREEIEILRDFAQAWLDHDAETEE